MYPEGTTIESRAVTRTKRQVSVNMNLGLECSLKFNPFRTKAPSKKKNDFQHQDHHNRRKRQVAVHLRFMYVVMVSYSPSRAPEGPL